MPDLNSNYCVTTNEMAGERRTKLRKLAHLFQLLIKRSLNGWSPLEIADQLRLDRHL